MLGADIIANVIARHGLKRIHIYPGGTIAPVLDAVVKQGTEVFCARHEQGAGYAALAAARLTGHTQVVMVTSGPGVTNVLTPVADAYFDSYPLVVLTGQVGTSDLRGVKPIRQSGFQEVDAIALLRPVTKAQFQITDPSQILDVMERAFQVSMSGRPGPVLVDLPMDVQRCEVMGTNAINSLKITSPLEPDSSLVEQAVEWLVSSSRPVILAGQGVLLSQAHRELRFLAERYQIPVSQSLLGLGAYPTTSPLALGFHGHTGNQYAALAIHNADLLLVIGSRLDVRQTGSCLDSFVPRGRVIRIDLDPGELAHSRVRTNLNIHADANKALTALNTSLACRQLPDWSAWRQQIKMWRDKFSLGYEKCNNLKPQYVIETANRLTHKQPLVCVSGVGAHQHWVARHFDFDFPKRMWLTSGGHGAMGYDLPVAIGAQLTRPETKVLCFVGDGSLQMNIQELATVAEYQLPIKIIIMDNHRLGMVSQFQKMNWNSDPACGHKWNPDFAAIGRSYGIASVTLKTKEEVEPTLRIVLADKSPALIHCIVDETEDVVPMLLGGQTMDRMWPYA